MNKGVKMAHGSFLNIVVVGDWLEKDALKQAWNLHGIFWAVTGYSIYERRAQCRRWLTAKQKTRILVSNLRAWQVYFPGL
jgi:hypothetical protein